MTPEPEWISQEIERQTNAKIRDVNKRQAEEAASKALKYAKQAYTLYVMAECPNFAKEAMDACHTLKAISK